MLAVSTLANAGSYLVSAPLPRGGSGDFVCACTNISKKDITIEINIKYDGSTGSNPVWCTSYFKCLAHIRIGRFFCDQGDADIVT